MSEGKPDKPVPQPDGEQGMRDRAAYDSLIYETAGPLAVVRLNRPDRYNALDASMGRDLLDAVLRVSHDPALRALMITGQGRAFCAGGDVKAFVEAGAEVPAYADRLTVDLHAAVSKLMRMEKPSLAAVNGPAAGAGFSLAMTCDLVVASEEASFTLAYTQIGASPDGSSTFTLPRILGVRRAMELALTNRTLNAQEAVAWGLANRLLPAEGFEREARRIAAQLAAGPTRAFGQVKALLYHSFHESLEGQLEREARAIVDASRSEDFREGTRAFVEKRQPGFKGK